MNGLVQQAVRPRTDEGSPKVDQVWRTLTSVISGAMLPLVVHQNSINVGDFDRSFTRVYLATRKAEEL